MVSKEEQSYQMKTYHKKSETRIFPVSPYESVFCALFAHWATWLYLLEKVVTLVIN